MATNPIPAVSAPVTHPRAVPPAPAVMAILNRFNRDELGNTIEVLVALLDIWDGDPDAEVTGAEDDFAELAAQARAGPGCPVADPPEEDDGDSAIDDGPCDEPDQDLEPDDDAEIEPMADDVPMLPAYSLDYGLADDKRAYLGMSNLQSSFVGEARSADTGTMHRGKPPCLRDKPGVPV